MFAAWFARHTSVEVEAALAQTSVLWERYRTFDEVVESGVLQRNPLFTELEQPGIGTYLAAGLPAIFDGEHYFAGPAPDLGSSTGF